MKKIKPIFSKMERQQQQQALLMLRNRRYSDSLIHQYMQLYQTHYLVKIWSSQSCGVFMVSHCSYRLFDKDTAFQSYEELHYYPFASVSPPGFNWKVVGNTPVAELEFSDRKITVVFNGKMT
ncbi:uncharacterized protein LOC110689398 isoform X1 [Chenopodium quinoa]|uniref:uncharacterized protein LOC110689398 isoform X1 n=1 Tax=Chenopodium quinoa TaxID=63459 RepID=UPI000B77300E|nr:uncharacterized protein LOC110689398 isoform X1 [Chenopodium quinoa]